MRFVSILLAASIFAAGTGVSLQLHVAVEHEDAAAQHTCCPHNHHSHQHEDNEPECPDEDQHDCSTCHFLLTFATTAQLTIAWMPPASRSIDLILANETAPSVAVDVTRARGPPARS